MDMSAHTVSKVWEIKTDVDMRARAYIQITYIRYGGIPDADRKGKKSLTLSLVVCRV